MKKGRIYTVVFMLIVSAFFTLLLAGANEIYLPIIQENELLAERSAILYVFDIDQSGSAEEILNRFEQNVKQTTISGIELYEYTSAEGEPVAYAVPFTGPGLWGSISGYLGVSSELDHITGLVFTDQSETPGLGGRIDELTYREQFKGLQITAGATLAYGEQGGGQVDAITGATSTSNSVLRILNQLLDDTVSKLEVSDNG
jgi:Na+-transporting NADH:ubiquinone oxidoreductase subunit C